MKVNLFYNNIYLATKYIKKTEDYKKDYKVTLLGKKKIIGLNLATIWLRPIALLHVTDKEIDLNCAIYNGAPITGGINE
jgi:hypothetical protein